MANNSEDYVRNFYFNKCFPVFLNGINVRRVDRAGEELHQYLPRLQVNLHLLPLQLDDVSGGSVLFVLQPFGQQGGEPAVEQDGAPDTAAFTHQSRAQGVHSERKRSGAGLNLDNPDIFGEFVRMVRPTKRGRWQSLQKRAVGRLVPDHFIINQSSFNISYVRKWNQIQKCII